MSDESPYVAEHYARSAADQSAAVRRTFGEALRKSRNDAELSRARIAALAGISEAELSDIEDGKIDPALTTMAALAMALGRDIWTLLP